MPKTKTRKMKESDLNYKMFFQASINAESKKEENRMRTEFNVPNDSKKFPSYGQLRKEMIQKIEERQKLRRKTARNNTNCTISGGTKTLKSKKKTVSKKPSPSRKTTSLKKTTNELKRMKTQFEKIITYTLKKDPKHEKLSVLKDHLKTINEELQNSPHSELTRKTNKLKLFKSKPSKLNMSKSKRRKTSQNSGMLTAHEITPEGQEYIKHMNVELASESEVKALQQFIKNNPVLKKQDDEFGKIFAWITEFMGDTHVWWHLLPDLTFNGVREETILSGKMKREKIPYKNFPRGKHVYDSDQAFFNGAHWNSQKAGSDIRFDPYDEFQPRGTNQFCQSYSMMHLLDALPGEKNQTCHPWRGDPKDFKKFYFYTECALHFILGIAEHCKKNNLDLEYDTPSGPYLDDVISMVKYCLKYYRICINTIKLP